MANRKLLGNILLLITTAIWGTAFAFQRMGMDSIEPSTFNAARMFLAAVAVTPLIALGRKKDKTDTVAFRKNTIIGGILCGLCLAGATIFQQVGMVQTSAGKAGFSRRVDCSSDRHSRNVSSLHKRRLQFIQR